MNYSILSAGIALTVVFAFYIWLYLKAHIKNQELHNQNISYLKTYTNIAKQYIDTCNIISSLNKNIVDLERENNKYVKEISRLEKEKLQLECENRSFENLNQIIEDQKQEIEDQKQEIEDQKQEIEVAYAMLNSQPTHDLINYDRDFFYYECDGSITAIKTNIDEEELLHIHFDNALKAGDFFIDDISRPDEGLMVYSNEDLYRKVLEAFGKHIQNKLNED